MQSSKQPPLPSATTNTRNSLANQMILLFGFALLQIIPATTSAQYAPTSGFASKQRRAAFYDNILTNYITKRLSLPLSDSTEDDWQDPFWPMELILYKSTFAENRIRYAWQTINDRTPGFQRAFLELLYTNYPLVFKTETTQLLEQTTWPRIFAMCAEYLMQNPADTTSRLLIRQQMALRFDTSADHTIEMLRTHLNKENNNTTTPPLKDILSPSFLPGQLVIYSLQRSNRDNPGIVLIRQPNGHFARKPDGRIFYVAQLARSITNLPWYLRNGNTPPGIYLLEGLGISHSNFLGPTPNLQLFMPCETTPRRFLRDSSIIDTSWNINLYKKLLPRSWQNDLNAAGSFYASQIGRTEIIAHGTTIDPAYYVGKAYYPQTPSLGCLCANELWDENGKRVYSDQQQLVDALQLAGGAKGYLVVIEIDDKNQPVQLKEITPLLN